LIEIEIFFPSEFSASRCEQVIENVATNHGLFATMKDTLKQFPGCIHWHYKRGKERGVLEITLWPQEPRAWISIHDNRKGEWMESVIPALLEHFRSFEFKGDREAT
jgi:hypothetical protein